jgi:signal transduction histidine kinase
MKLKFHPVLERIIRKSNISFNEEDTEQLRFLEGVSNSFYNNDREREISEHAFDVSEQEYQNITKTLKIQDEEKDAFISKLKNTIIEFENSDFNFTDKTQDLNSILDHLKSLVINQKQVEVELTKAKQKAEKAAQAKSDFLSIMSHEIRTPLNAIIGIASLLKDKQEQVSVTENINALKFSSEHLLYLINDILDFSKIEEGGIVFQENDIDLKKLLEDIAQMNSYKASEKNTHIKVHVDKKIPTHVVGDVLRLKQVLSNLIANAIKFSDEGNVEVFATLQDYTSNEVSILFEVIDNGIGIAQEKQKEIFEKFTQAENTIAGEFGGTGLGLTITKKILQLQNSDIFVESELQKGSRFYFTLTFIENKKIINNEEYKFTEKSNLAGVKILLVDDNKLNLLVAKQFLNKWKAEVTTSISGITAIEQTKENNFDLVLMDLMMPVMDGFEASSIIQKNNPTLPIIALTASSTNEIREKVQASNMCDFISKPFDADEMLATILKHL